MKPLPRRVPLPRLSVPMADALAGHEGLGSLLQRIQASNARLADARAVLPAGLAAHVLAGPLDESGWTLLARSGSAAAKLRQCLPGIQQRLTQQGWPEVPIRVKVHVSREV